MNRLKSLLQRGLKVKPVIIGMVHVQALPGTPRNCLAVSDIVSKAVSEAVLYRNYGVDGLIVENMNDIPYVMSERIGPEIVATMTVVCQEVRRACPDMPIGLQILAGGNQEALATALAADLDFIRAECFVFSHVADEGLMNACAGELLRFRRAIGAERVSVLTDIKKKHSSHAITADITIAETAKAAEFFLADGVIVTGVATGAAASVTELSEVKGSVSIPVFIGSGVTEENMADYLVADGLIVGSHFKFDGKWSNDIDESRLAAFMAARNKLLIKTQHVE